MATVTVRIVNTADDVSAYSIGSVALEATLPATGTTSGLLFHAGLRFRGVAVPQGATITSASLTLRKDAANSVAGTFGLLAGVAADNPPVWTTVASPISAAKTTQTVAVVDGTTQTYDVAAIVQAIVNRAGWAAGNALAFVSNPTGATGMMAWVDYSASTTNCAELTITFESGGGPTARPRFQALIIG